MGYCIRQRKVNFLIKSENKAKALEAIKTLASKETIKDSFGKHFAWVDSSYFMRAVTLEEALEAWRWEAITEGNGNITRVNFAGEKYGDDMIMFKVIAPFVVEGSYIEMSGEDGTIWRWVFENNTVVEKQAKMTF